MKTEEAQLREDLKNDPELLVQVPAKQVPPYRYAIAQERGIKQMILTTWGGCGDQVCGEPTARYAFKLFEGYEISLLTSYPDLFTHLPFKKIYHKSEAPNLNDQEWLVKHTNPSNHFMARDFINHHFTQVVDFSSLCAFQRQLPIEDRAIKLPKSDFGERFKLPILIHPGRHWESKTFPKMWWDAVIGKLAKLYPFRIGIIGKDVDAETGTVDVEVPEGVFDFRNKMSILDLSSALQAAQVVVTNDSAPLHIAAAGFAKIIFISSCKESDHLKHWRRSKQSGKVEWAWNMKNMELTGLWEMQSSIPIRDTEFRIDLMSPEMMEKILPDPMSVVDEVAYTFLSLLPQF